MSTSNLNEFEKQLKAASQPNAQQSLEVFQKQLQAQSQNPAGASQEKLPPGAVKVKKNIVLSFMSDSSGCGHIRNVFWLTYLNSVFGKTGQMNMILSPTFIYQNDILARARSLFFQRQMTPDHLKVIKQYKQHQAQFKYKMIWEMDDHIHGFNENQDGNVEDGVPSYNFGSKGISIEIKEASVEIMKLMDLVIVSTTFLKDYYQNELGIKTPITVVPNCVPKYFWGYKRKDDITETIKKPKVIYTGSPTHYSNGEKLLGDWDNAWKEWVLKAVKNDEIEFAVFGGLPWFLEPIKDKIKVHGWVNSYQYPNVVRAENADFGIMPLVRNNFNRAKSDLKFLEHSADGSLAIGTTFTDGSSSPYDHCFLTLPEDCTVEDIDVLIKKHCEPNNFNRVRRLQYEKMENEGRYLESKQYIDRLINVF
jgi:hypothetical protein